MRASEFLSESDLQLIYEKGFLNKLGSAALEFGKGAGLLSNTWGELDALEKKLEPGKIANASADALNRQLKLIKREAKKKGIAPDSEQYTSMIDATVLSLFKELKADIKDPEIQKQIKHVQDVAKKGGNAGNEMHDVAKSLAKKQKEFFGTGSKNPKLKDSEPFTARAVPGPDSDNEPSLYVEVDKGVWEKYVDKQGDGTYTLEKVNPADMAEFEKTHAKQARQFNLLRVDDKTIGFGDEKQDDALQQDAENDAEQDSENAQKIEPLAQAIVKHASETDDPEGTAEQMMASTIQKNGLEEPHAEKLKELVQKGLAGDEEGPIDQAWENEFVGKVVDYIKQNPDGFGDEDAVAQFVNHQFNVNNVSDEDAQDRMMDAILTNPEMPYGAPTSTGVPERFNAEVFFPQGKDYSGDKIAYANDKGEWSLWRMAKPGQWEYVRNVSDENTIAQIEQTIASDKLQPRPMSFKQGEDQYYQVK